MPKFPTLKPKETIKILKRAGFVEIRSKGSHVHFIKENNIVTVPMHNRDLKIKTLKSIIKQTNLTVDEFFRLS